MELEDLQTFETIVRLGHVGHAADQLGRSQPALTKAIRRLEARFGTLLFRRVGRRLVLTEAGEALLEQAGRLNRLAEETRRRLAEHAGAVAGAVRIGAGATAVEHLLPHALSKVLAAAPELRFTVRVAMQDVLQAALTAGEIDLRIGPLPEQPDPAIESRLICYDEAVIAARRGHHLTRPGVTLADLAGAGWALPGPDVASRRWLEAALAAAGQPRPRVVLETNLIQVQPSLIAATDLLTLIARRNLDPARADMRLAEIPLSGFELRRPIGVCWLREGYLSPASLRFISALEAVRDIVDH